MILYIRESTTKHTTKWGQITAVVLPDWHQQEEDFFTQLYKRSLLSVIQSDHIITLAEEVSSASKINTTIPSLQRDAIHSRINLQLEFLIATRDALDSTSEAVKASWQRLSTILQSARLTHHVGIPVPDAISAKIQRRLASSVPPQPVVELGFDLAMDFLSRLCKDGVLAEGISECNDLGSTMVSLLHSRIALS